MIIFESVRDLSSDLPLVSNRAQRESFANKEVAKFFSNGFAKFEGCLNALITRLLFQVSAKGYNTECISTIPL